MNYDQILASPYDEETSIKQQLQKLLTAVIHENSNFNGKRPFDGDSHYYFSIYVALAKAGVPCVTIDEDGYVDGLDEFATIVLITELIDHIFNGGIDV
jgi:hypothetical protein